MLREIQNLQPVHIHCTRAARSKTFDQMKIGMPCYCPSRSATKCSPYAVKPSSSSRAEQPQDGSGILAEYPPQRAIHGCARSHVTDSSIQDASPHVPNSVSQIGTACPCANASSRMRAKYCGNDSSCTPA